MLYVCSKQENINNYWVSEFNTRYGVKLISSGFFDFKHDFKNDDLLILDLEQFDTLDEIIEYFNSIPKILKSIAVVDEPKLAHGTYIIKKGFKSYLGKKTSKHIIEQAISTVKDGNVWLYPELMNYIIKNISVNSENTDSEKILEKLTLKEKTVANHVADGLSNKEIAQVLDVQLVTVKKHIGNIFLKLNVKDRVALAILLNR